MADPTGSATVGRFVAVAKHNADDTRAARLIDTATLVLILLYSTLALLAWWPLMTLLEHQLPAESLAEGQALLSWMLIALIMTVAATSSADALDGLQRADLRAIIMMIGYLIMLFCALFLIEDFGLVGLAIAQIVQFTFVVVTARLLLRRSIPTLTLFPMTLSPDLVRELLSYGAKVQLASIANSLTEPLVKIMLNQTAGLASVGLYEIASRIVVQARQLLVSGIMTLIPLFALTKNMGDPDIRPVVLKAQRILFFAIPGIAMAILVASPVASWLLIGHVEKDLIFYTAILACGYGINTTTALIYIHAQAVGNFKWNLLGQFSIGITTIVLGTLLSPALGGFGVIIAFGLGLAVTCNLFFVRNMKADTLPLFVLVPPLYLAAMVAMVLMFASIGVFAASRLL